MMRSMFSAISGLKVHQTMLDVTSNNIANVNTLGYKSARTTFKDSLYQMQRGATAPAGNQGGNNAAQVGLGVQLGSIDNMMQGGAIQPTGNVLDLALQGEGWFRVANGAPPAVPAGGFNVQYTRAGNFARNQDGFLVTQEGYYVVGKSAPGLDPTNANDIYLNIPADASNVAIGQDGAVTYDDAAGARQTAGYISLARFANEAGLERASGNRWTASNSSGAEATATSDPQSGYGLVTSGAIEMSNVDLATEFTTMITAQRGFQANSRAISTSDEMLQELVNLKR